MNIGDEPVFPFPSGSLHIVEHDGMTYRQWLVGMALQGLLAHGRHPNDAGRYAVESADGAIAELEKKVQS